MITNESKLNYIKFSFADKLLIFFTVVTPFFLPFSRFLSDLFLCFTVILFILISLLKSDFKLFFRNYSILFLLWYVYIFFTSLIAEDIILSFESTLFYFRFYFYSLAILYCLKNYKKIITYFSYTLGMSTLILLFDSYFQLFFGYNILGYEYDNSWSRLSSFFKDEYILGSYLSRILPLLIGLILLSDIKFKFRTLFIISIIIFSFIIILYAGDRAGLLYFLIFLTLSILLLNLSKMYKFSIFVLSCLLFCLLIFTSNTVYERMIKYTKYQIFQDNKINPFSIQHQLIFETSTKIIKENYFFGIGPKNYRIVCKNFKSSSNLDLSEDGCSTHPHNTYIQLLVETGVLGFFSIFFGFIFIFYYLLKKIYKTNFSNKYNNSLSIDFLFIALFISLWPLVPTGSFFNNWLNIIYYLPVGFLIYYFVESKDEY